MGFKYYHSHHLVPKADMFNGCPQTQIILTYYSREPLPTISDKKKTPIYCISILNPGI